MKPGSRLLPKSMRSVIRNGLIVLFVPIACSSQENGHQQQLIAAETFVYEFYSSYQTRLEVHENASIPAWVSVAREEASLLASELARALFADYEEARQSPGELDGLSFDPFLGSQDPCDNYRVEEVDSVATGIRAKLYGDCTGTGERQPDVIAELVRVNGGFRFSNFYYPPLNTDLLTVLTLWRDGRRGI